MQKEWNKGHGSNAPKSEQKDHIHDYKPNPNNPSGRGERMPGRPPRQRDLNNWGQNNWGQSKIMNNWGQSKKIIGIIGVRVKLNLVSCLFYSDPNYSDPNYFGCGESNHHD